MVFMNRLNVLIIMIAIVALVSCAEKKVAFFSYVNGATGITGTVTQNGVHAEGIEVYLYRNKKSNFRGPADFVDITSASGNYFIDVPEGEYYIIARKRASGSNTGPIKKGDVYSDPIYEPVLVKSGQTSRVDLTLKQLFGELIQKESGQEKTETYISGVITDAKGSPLKGVYAFAYKNDDFKREPDFFSTETGADGLFTIYFKEGGKYFIGGRSPGRGVPKHGELYGFYESPRGSGVLIKNNEKILDIKIILKKYK